MERKGTEARIFRPEPIRQVSSDLRDREEKPKKVPGGSRPQRNMVDPEVKKTRVRPIFPNQNKKPKKKKNHQKKKNQTKKKKSRAEHRRGIRSLYL